MDEQNDKVAIVVIGRNEGERLRACLGSLEKKMPVIYVDSGSIDGSPALARSLGIDVIELDSSRPFTAARGRNAGAEEMMKRHSDLQAIQFVDGDSLLSKEWIAAGWSALSQKENTAAIFGNLHERYPERSIYNRLCDLEWKVPNGIVDSFSGIVLMRVKAFRDVGGYNEHIPSGEEPELSLRLRQKGWMIEKIDIPMGVHDAAMKSINQWWTRGVRAGYGLILQGHLNKKIGRQIASNLFWGLLYPLCLIIGVGLYSKWFLLGLTVYPLLAARIFLHRKDIYHDSDYEAGLYAFFCILSKLPQALGFIYFLWMYWRKDTFKLIEHK